MRPILYDQDEKFFKSEGLGRLRDCLRCVTREKLSGEYELELDYPIDGQIFNELRIGRIVSALPSPYREAQPFRIYRIEKKMDGICTCHAQHISYDLCKIPERLIDAGSLAEALTQLKSKAFLPNDFNFVLGDAADHPGWFYTTRPLSARAILGGDGGILEQFGGELLFDKFTVTWLPRRGSDKGTIINYGKNLLDIVQDTDGSDQINSTIPYWQSGNIIVQPVPEIVEFVPGVPGPRSIPLDLSSEFSEQPTPEQLREAAVAYMQRENLKDPKISIDAEFLSLDQMEGFAGDLYREAVDLGDTVHIRHAALGISATARIEEIETDVLQERYISTQIGPARQDIADTILRNTADIDNLVRR